MFGDFPNGQSGTFPRGYSTTNPSVHMEQNGSQSKIVETVMRNITFHYGLLRGEKKKSLFVQWMKEHTNGTITSIETLPYYFETMTDPEVVNKGMLFLAELCWIDYRSEDTLKRKDYE